MGPPIQFVLIGKMGCHKRNSRRTAFQFHPKGPGDGGVPPNPQVLHSPPPHSLTYKVLTLHLLPPIPLVFPTHSPSLTKSPSPRPPFSPPPRPFFQENGSHSCPPPSPPLPQFLFRIAPVSTKTPSSRLQSHQVGDVHGEPRPGAGAEVMLRAPDAFLTHRRSPRKAARELREAERAEVEKKPARRSAVSQVLRNHQEPFYRTPR